jgi:hypothetical protein
MIGFNGEEMPVRRKVSERSIGFIDETIKKKHFSFWDG